MSNVSENALRLAGFLLAHATWIIADLEPGQLYVPQALCLKDGELSLNVFEADTQVEAVANGKAFMEKEAGNFDGCAFARDGLVRQGEKAIDTLTIDMANEDGDFVLTMIQPYSKQEEMRLLGSETFLTPEGSVTADATGDALRPIIREGADSHASAIENWTALNTSRLTDPGLF